MATITGMTASAMQDILDNTVESVAIVGNNMVFTKHDASTFSVDFATFIGDDVDTKIADALTNTVLPAITGGLTAKGNITGAVSFAGIDKDNLPNRMFTATLTGNISIAASALPADAYPGTQFAFRMTQDATGSRLLTLTNIKASQGVLALSTAPSAIDIIVFMFDGTNWYAGAMGLAFS